VSSISGSDTEEDSEEEDDEGSDGGGGSGDEAGGGAAGEPGARRPARRGGRQRDASGRAPQLVFRSADGTPLAVWRCLLYPDHTKARPPDASLLPELRRVRAACLTWAVLLLRGGHFAGAVFRMKPGPPGKGQHAGEPFEVVAHKTFHRYVVRWARGGGGVARGWKWPGSGAVRASSGGALDLSRSGQV
jgi:hypothetical protein